MMRWPGQGGRVRPQQKVPEGALGTLTQGYKEFLLVGCRDCIAEEKGTRRTAEKG